MSKLCDVANDCSFANKVEIVTFLFLIHNTNDRVKDQLIEKMKTMDTLTDILQLAKSVESTVQKETLSKQLIQNVEKLNTTTEVHAVQKHHYSKRNVSNQILQLPVVGNHPVGMKDERSVVIVVIPTFKSNVLPMAKNVSNARRRIISQSFVRVQRKSQVVGLATLNIFQGKTFMKWKSQSLIWHWYFGVEMNPVFHTCVQLQKRFLELSEYHVWRNVRVKETTLSPNWCMFKEQNRNFFTS